MRFIFLTVTGNPERRVLFNPAHIMFVEETKDGGSVLYLDKKHEWYDPMWIVKESIEEIWDKVYIATATLARH